MQRYKRFVIIASVFLYFSSTLLIFDSYQSEYQNKLLTLHPLTEKADIMRDNPNEQLPVVDESGNILGAVTRGHAHDGSKILHPAGPSSCIQQPWRSLSSAPSRLEGYSAGEVGHRCRRTYRPRRECRRPSGVRSARNSASPISLLRASATTSLRVSASVSSSMSTAVSTIATSVRAPRNSMAVVFGRPMR